MYPVRQNRRTKFVSRPELCQNSLPDVIIWTSIKLMFGTTFDYYYNWVIMLDIKATLT